MKKILLVVLLSVFGLAGVLTLKCNFEGEYSIKGEDNTARMTMVYKYDDVSGKAYTEGNNGLSEAKIILGSEGELLSFVELTSSNNLMTMSVNLDSNGTNAVYSRHVKIITKIFPSQRYGHCESSYKESPEILEKSNRPTKDDLRNIAIKLNLGERIKGLPEKDVEIIRDTLQGKLITEDNLPKDLRQETLVITAEILVELMDLLYGTKESIDPGDIEEYKGKQ